MKLEFEQLKKIDDYRYLIPKSTKPGMRTEALIYANEKLLRQILNDLSLEQAINVACLPGIVGRSLAMPDIHQGYGFPIGGVAATDARTGVVSPGGVGFDINCGVRLLGTSLRREEVAPRIKELVHQLFRDVPCGTGTAGPVPCSPKEIDQVLARGARWVVEERGLGAPADVEHCEAEGALAGADPDKVSRHAKQRGAPQLGTLGSGNHFLEVQYVEKIVDADAARALGLREGQVVVLIHCGSRGLGHQVCTDYLKEMGAAMQRYSIELPDRQLACVPINSPEGRSYLGAMNAAANFAWANRQAIAHFTRKAVERLFGPETEVRAVYDIAHNIAKRERYTIDGEEREVLVHRKGATRAFAPGRAEVPAAYRAVGQPVLIPGSMGTASWVLVGTEGAMQETFGTVCHGAGRQMSRTQAKKSEAARTARQRLEEQGIYVKSQSRDGIAEEIPEAYKDVDEVIEVVHQAGISKKVARLKPMGVIKG
ncbi:MAG: RtcB family protein [Acidobacteria bacterium]|nr:RtcB family protein [Acidobacteriota bacterium]